MTYNTPFEWWLTWCYTWAWIGMVFEVDCRHEFKRFYGNPLTCQ